MVMVCRAPGNYGTGIIRGRMIPEASGREETVKTIAVAPSFAEEELIQDTVASLRAINEVKRVIVVDDASSDGTARRRAGRASVVANGRNLVKVNI